MMIEPPPFIAELAPLVGVEHSLHDVNYALKVAVRGRRPPVVGALQVTCSDETEFETIESFQTSLARDLLPRLKYAHRSAFHTSNLGGRFEWDSLRVTEDHFAGAMGSHQRLEPMVIVVKISSHVAVEESRGQRRFGVLRRYGKESSCCSALATVVEGSSHPRADGLREVLCSEGLDRVAALQESVDPEHQPLFAALLSARLQARSATLEAQDLDPTVPVLFLIVPAVTLNKADRDGEIVCGLYVVDRRQTAPGSRARAWYRGLGDRPEHYQLTAPHGRLTVHDDGSPEERPARDHRMLIRRARERVGEPDLGRDQRIDEALDRARLTANPDPHLTRALLKTLLVALAEVSPVPAALLLFSHGATGIYHAYRAHRMVEDVAASSEAREVLADLERQVDRLPPERARQVLGVLLAEYGG